jgi:hypothetical protein
MKEEVGMNRWKPSGTLAVIAAAGMLAVSASTAMAVSEGSPYTNQGGISTADTEATMTLNPGLSGQWLWGTYYDVRPVKNGSTGASDPQDVNIQILNNNPNNPNSAGYNENGGILARVRFRESKTSQEVLDFDIVLSCAEVWTGKVELPSGASLPRIVSNDPIRSAGGPNAPTLTTGPLLAAGGRSFIIPSGLAAADVQRGYFEVIAMEALPCEPDEGQVVRTGNVWSRLSTDQGAAIRTPSNALSAEVVLIRVAAGVSHIYNAEAVSRWIVADLGNQTYLPASGQPQIDNCVAETQFGTGCVNQMNFILSKSRVMAQYDIDTLTGGSTRVVFTLPTKRDVCNLLPSGADFNGDAKPPFACRGANTPGAGLGGEQIGCIPYNRLEDYTTSDDIFSPGVSGAKCLLPREMSIVNIVANDSPTSNNLSSVSDELINVTSIPREHLTGWVDFNLVRDPGQDTQVHEQNGLNVNLLGSSYTRYEGLPAITLILQEYINSNLAPSGVYGGAVPAPYEVYYALGS